MDERPPTFGEELRRIRTEHGLGLRAVEKLSQHSRTLLSEWERGKTPPPDSEKVQRLDILLEAGGALVAAASHAQADPETLTPEISRHCASQEPLAGEIRRRAAAGTELDLLAVRGLGLIALNDSLLRARLAARNQPPLHARILLLDPDCDAAGQRASEIGESPATFTAGIKYTLARLEEVAAAATGLDLDVRLYTSLPVWRIVRVDHLMWVGGFAPGREGHESTVHELIYTERGSLWQGFRRQIDDLHAHARRVV